MKYLRGLAVAVSVLVLLSPLHARQQVARPAWSGSFLDANGRKGTIELTPSEGGRSGRLRIRISDRDAALDIGREVTIERDGEKIRLRAPNRAKESPMEWQATLTQHEAAPYAKAALLGEYVAKAGVQDLPMTRGVMVLWQFRE